ncbi:hypothetical protein XFF6960_430015 [Xanthomonas citri pv. fuscans]|nr:hypothetical protein XFF6960_430015 [Xanthomonas citri pv. fuscans]
MALAEVMDSSDFLLTNFLYQIFFLQYNSRTGSRHPIPRGRGGSYGSPPGGDGTGFFGSAQGSSMSLREGMGRAYRAVVSALNTADRAKLPKTFSVRVNLRLMRALATVQSHYPIKKLPNRIFLRRRQL